MGLVCVGCTASTDAEDEASPASIAQALVPGVNGDACLYSPYNCKLRVEGGNRVLTNDGSDSWGVTPGQAIRDGNGTVLNTSTNTTMKFNYGQVRTFVGEPHAFAMSTSNGGAGWVPMASILGRSSFEQKVGHVSAMSEGLARMGCYEVKNSSDPNLEPKKVVYDSTSSNEAAGDYLPKVRANGLRSVNLAFNCPGASLGAPAVDHYPAGTKFQRVDVPTDSGAPSIDVPLWVQDASGRYRQQDGVLKFVYGYVISANGAKRVGWIPYDALQASSECP